MGQVRFFIYGKEFSTKPLKVFFCLCSLLVVAFFAANLAYAGTATITGNVVAQDGDAPLSQAAVTIKVTGKNANPDFKWAVYKATSDAQGNFSVKIQFPDIVETAFVVEALSLKDGVCRYAYAKKEFSYQPPLNNGSHNFPLKAAQVLNYIFVQGHVTDNETGEPIRTTVEVKGDNVAYFLYLDTDPTGFYKGLIMLYSPYDSKITLKSGLGKDYRYIMQSRTKTLSPKQTYTINFQLGKSKTAAYIHGTVTDAESKKPIPFATVSVSTEKNWNSGTFSTDALGRYFHYVPGNGTTHSVSTTGIHSQNTTISPYNTGFSSLTVQSGESIQLDFALTKK